MLWDDHKIVAADLETSGTLPEYALQPWRMSKGGMWITSASMLKFADGNLVPHVSQLMPPRETIRQMLLDAVANQWTILGWNIAFDISVMMALGPDIEQLCMQVQWLDGMLIERHYDIEPEYEFQTRKHLKKSYSLKGYTDTSGRWFDGAVQRWIPQFAGLDEDVEFHNPDPVARAKLQLYNDRDNVRAWTIAKMIWAKLTDTQRRAVVIEAASLPMVAQANLYGLPIDVLTAKQLGLWLDQQATTQLTALAPDGITEAIVRSPAKLGNLMFNDPGDPVCPGWGLPVLKTNKSKVEGKEDSRSTDKEVLHELSFVDARVKGVKAYREALNARGKFCNSVLESVEYNDQGYITHPLAKIFATYTGRMTVASKQGRGVEERPIGWALHQMKREAEYREIVTAFEGYDLVEFDAAGQEYRWMAIASGDATMLGLCMPGEDAHSFMGARITLQDYRELVRRVEGGDKGSEQTRYLGKFANLSLQYRTSARKLRSKARVDYDIPLEMPEAYRIHKTYQQAYPGVPVYWEQQIAIVKACGYVEDFAGNRVQVVGDWSGKWAWSMGSTAINARIQGTGAAQKHLAMAAIKHPLNQYGGRFLFDLHDGLYLVIPSAIRQKAVIELKHILDNLPYRELWGFTPPVPMPWDCKVGVAGTPSCAWGRMKKVDFDKE